jgi:hypothetical protein
MNAPTAAPHYVTLGALEPSTQPKRASARRYNATARQPGISVSVERLTLEYLCQDKRPTELNTLPGLDGYTMKGIEQILARIRRAYGVHTNAGAVARYLTSDKQPAFVGGKKS